MAPAISAALAFTTSSINRLAFLPMGRGTQVLFSSISISSFLEEGASGNILPHPYFLILPSPSLPVITLPHPSSSNTPNQIFPFFFLCLLFFVCLIAWFILTENSFGLIYLQPFLFFISIGQIHFTCMFNVYLNVSVITNESEQGGILVQASPT